MLSKQKPLLYKEEALIIEKGIFILKRGINNPLIAQRGFFA